MFSEDLLHYYVCLTLRVNMINDKFYTLVNMVNDYNLYYFTDDHQNSLSK